ncbi:MAG TPA: amidohydrolase, partial [Sphingomicrobium sp.]|nr:amidohydrolase [Sphingomicrobium sp.]
MKKLLWLAAAAMTVTTPAAAASLPDSIQADMPMLMNLYRDLHAHPELSMMEVRTPALLAGKMRELGFDVTEHVGKTGVVAVMKNGPGPVLLIRADMDALPVKEQTGLPFASKVRAKTLAGVETDVMHACGHDTHITTWLATARRLSSMKDQWSGTVVMILQPGEELVMGAKAMLDDGLFTRFPKPDYLLAFHDSASLPAGVIGVTPGYALANVDTVNIDVKGVGGHGAYPQNTKDPIVLGSQIVLALQTLVSRENDPLEPAVVTVGSFHSGTKSNIISDEAKLALTVRSYTPETRKLLL